MKTKFNNIKKILYNENLTFKNSRILVGVKNFFKVQIIKKLSPIQETMKKNILESEHLQTQ